MQNIKSISQKLQTIWKKTYIVGWWCRKNILKNSEITDVDLATDTTPEEIKNVLCVIKEVWKKYGTMIIKEWDEVFEITTFRSDIWILNNRKPVKVEFTNDLVLDSKRRDFTINSIYYDVENEVFINPQNGIQDLQNSIIRFVWDIENRIKEDALRILRFVRLKNKYNLKVAENNYFDILKQNIDLLKNISVERIKEEFDKILLLEKNIEALNDLKKIWFFETIIPEIENLEKTPWWPSHHLEWNVWIHTLMIIKELNKIFKNWFDIIDKNWNDIKKYFTNDEKIDFYWTMLLHDISKYETYSLDEKWGVHYYNHEKLWSIKSQIILKKFKFSSKSIKKILWLIENHLKIFKVFDMRILKCRKFMMEKYFEDLMIVWIVDHMWRIPSDENLVLKLKEFYKDFIIILKNKKFLTGRDIIKIYPWINWIEIKNKLNSKNDEILLNDLL
jgi:tRNA nucleotidyltransferase (CCA-adding enzyme)